VTHLGLDRLAELEEGLLAPDEEAAAQAHVRDCADCGARQAQLSGTRRLLSTLPAEPMPSEVSARIDAALTGLPFTTIVPLAGRKRGWRAHPTAAGLGAAAAVAALVAALVVGRTSSRPSSTEDGSQALGAPDSTAAAIPLPPNSTTGTKYTFRNLGRTVPMLLAPAAALAVAPEGTNATPQPSPDAASADQPPAALNRLFTTPGALEACVRGIEGGPAAAPLAIDFARFAGAPAVLVVLPGLEAGKVDAWFVGPDCTETDVDLLRYRSLPAPSVTSPSPGG
jgi:hypothetical protein